MGSNFDGKVLNLRVQIPGQNQGTLPSVLLYVHDLELRSFVVVNGVAADVDCCGRIFERTLKSLMSALSLERF